MGEPSCCASTSSVDAVRIGLRFLHNEAESLGNTCLEQSQQIVWYAKLAGAFAACNAAVCIPLVTWQLRRVDRVWRMRNAATVHRHRIAIFACGGTALFTGIIGLWSPIGLLAHYDALYKHRLEADRIGWDALVLRQQLLRCSSAPNSENNVTLDEAVHAQERLTRELVDLTDKLH